MRGVEWRLSLAGALHGLAPSREFAWASLPHHHGMARSRNLETLDPKIPSS